MKKVREFLAAALERMAKALRTIGGGGGPG